MARNLQKLANRLSDRVEAAVEAIQLAAIDDPGVVPLLRKRISQASSALRSMAERPAKEQA